MTHPLDEARTKLARADHHLDELDREVRRFVDAHRYEFWSDFKTEPGVIRVRARAVDPEGPVPLIVGTIVGDVFHNLRCALEYLAWQLAVVGIGPDNDTHFPVCDEPAKWKAFGQGYVRRMRKEHAALIERLQPYHGGHRVLLLPVMRLNNTDKHALITSVSWGSQFRPPTVEGGIKKLTIVYDDIQVPMHDGAVMFRITELEPLFDGADVKMKMDIPYTVLFGKPFTPKEVAVSRLDLVRTVRYVRLILRLFDADLAPDHRAPP